MKLTFIRNVPQSDAQAEIATLRRNGNDVAIGKPKTENDIGDAYLVGIYLVEDDDGSE